MKRTEVRFLDIKKTLGHVPRKIAFGNQHQLAGIATLLHWLKMSKCFQRESRNE